MSKITISIRLEEETVELLKIAAMKEGLRRANYDLSYINLIEEAINEAYSNRLFPEARKEKQRSKLANKMVDFKPQNEENMDE